MILCTNTNTELYFSSVKDISNTIWKELSCSKNLYFHPDYLYALEKNNPQITFSYIVLCDENKSAIALAIIQIVDFHLDKIENSISNHFYKLKCLGRRLGVFSKLKPIKLLICGNIFVSGEHGVFIKKSNDKKIIVNKLAKSISKLTNENSTLFDDISIFLIKDFLKESLNIFNELLKSKYYSFNVEPNMMLLIDTHWNSFQDYLDNMKTRYRVKAKRALNLSNNLIVKDSSKEHIESLLPQITNLYKKVTDKADFNLEHFNLQTYISLKNSLGNNYIFKTYWNKNKLVGFMSGMITNNTLDAHFVGIDYSLNKELAIYQRMLYDYVKIAINKNVKTINFGRTASEIKSSIGAIPQELTCYIRHKKTIPNKLLKPFLNHIKTTPFKQKKPFKASS